MGMQSQKQERKHNEQRVRDIMEEDQEFFVPVEIVVSGTVRVRAASAQAAAEKVEKEFSWGRYDSSGCTPVDIDTYEVRFDADDVFEERDLDDGDEGG